MLKPLQTSRGFNIKDLELLKEDDMSVDIQWRRSNSPHKKWTEIPDILKIVEEEGGIMRLKNGDNTLSVEVDKIAKLYLPILLSRSKGELYFFYSPDKEMKVVDFNGNMESEALLTDDFNLILRLAKEFFDTGDVKCMVPEDDLPEVFWEG